MLSKARTHSNIPLGARSASKFSMPRVVEQPELNELQKTLIVQRRIRKAERDERMDITKSLTPVKTYMGGFTRPQDLRASNWWSGGRYKDMGKRYESPPDSAYEPHTVVLLETRYNVVHEIGRADCLEHIVVVCREGDLPQVLEAYNSARSPEIEAMVNARWPWSKQKHRKTVVWWGAEENPDEEVRKLWAGEGPGFEVTNEDIWKLEEEQKASSRSSHGLSYNKRAPRRGEGYHGAQRGIVTKSSGSKAPSGGRIRAFHTYMPLASDEKSSTPEDRAKIPLSSWSKPPKESQDAHDDVVPVYYVERKRQLDEILERKEEEGSLMAQLSAGILSEGIAAQTRAREEKIPVEVREEDGVVRHPSGFEPPTPETEFHPVASKPNLEDDPLLTTVKVPWDEALAPSDSDAESVSLPSGTVDGPSKATRGFHTSALVRAMEASNLPFHVLNVPKPPQEQADDALLKALGSSGATLEADDALIEALESSEAALEDIMEEEDGEDGEKLEWEEQERDEDANAPQLKVGRKDAQTHLGSDRGRWLQTLKTEPFWRPLMSMTFSTRPVALTVARLSRAHPRGTPFYVSVAPEDRKDGKSFSLRMREMRMRRMRQLAMGVGQLFRGERGGFIGIRFGIHDRGRGINGERMAEPLPHDKRVIKVGVGEWTGFAEQMKQVVREEADDLDLGDGVQVFGIDEFGRRTDGMEWTPVKEIKPFNLEGRALQQLTPEAQRALTRKEKLNLLTEYIQKHGRNQVAVSMCGAHPSVYYPPKLRSTTTHTENEVQEEVQGEIQEEVDVASHTPESQILEPRPEA